MRTVDATHCPKNASGREYIAHVTAAIEAGRQIIPPANKDQLEALMEFSPRLGKLHLPRPEILVRFYGLPAWYGRDVPAYDEYEQERILVTIATDDAFAKAFVAGIRRFL